jgi:hypothetical protein
MIPAMSSTQSCALLALLTASACGEFNAARGGRMRAPCDPKHIRQLLLALGDDVYTFISRKGFAKLSPELRVHLRSSRPEHRLIALPYAAAHTFAAFPALKRAIAEQVPHFPMWHRLFASFYASPQTIEGLLALRHQTRALRPLAPDISDDIHAVTNGPLVR